VLAVAAVVAVVVVVAVVEMAGRPAGSRCPIAIDAHRSPPEEKAAEVAATQMMARALLSVHPRLCLHTWTQEASLGESRRLGDAHRQRDRDLVMKPMESYPRVPRPAAPRNNPSPITRRLGPIRLQLKLPGRSAKDD